MIKSIIWAIGLAVPILATGCATRVVYTSPPPPPPVAVESAPPPAAPPPGYVPDYYVWDGYEYVGVYGDQYVYWTGGAWTICSPSIVVRFHGWEHYHPGWRGHAYHYYYRGRPHYR